MWKDPIPRSRQKESRERVEYLADLRNQATAEALKLYPDTEHILSIESFYLKQVDAIRRLIELYDGRSIIGASTWYWDRSRILRTARFYDTWSTPGSEKMKFHHFGPKGILRVESVGSCLIFPRRLWELHGFAVPEPFPEAGCHYNYLCEKSDLPVWLSLDVKLWRDRSTNPDIPEYSWLKRIRCSLHLARFRTLDR